MAEQAQDTLAVKQPAVARARATLAFFQSSGFEAGRDHAADWVDLARASGDDYELAHALTMLAGALQMTEPTLDAAIATTEEAARVARTAGIDSALAIALPNLATWLPLEESERARALLDEAIEIATRIGDRQSVAQVMSNSAMLAARRGDWRTALQGAVDAAEQALELGDHGLVSRSLSRAGVALCALGSCEPAAVLFGKSAAIQERWGPDTTLELLAATDTALRESLGEQQVATLTAQGAALDITDAVAYLHAEADRALTAP